VVTKTFLQGGAIGWSAKGFTMKLFYGRRRVLQLAGITPVSAIAAAGAPLFAEQRSGATSQTLGTCPPGAPQPTINFPWLQRYAADNARVASLTERPRLVLLGDSITERWLDRHPVFFRDGWVNRGISGQTTQQILLRVMADVVALKPRALHLMAGTNDVACNTGPMTREMTMNNLVAMAMIARSFGITVLFGAIPPAAGFNWRPEIKAAQPIIGINQALREYCAVNGFAFLDYHQALSDEAGAMKPGLSFDGVHPTPDGYAVMERIASPVLEHLGLL
jgi:lysophospholipase L1-like esterase